MTASPKILLVDDRDENLLALEALLSPHQAELLKARSGDEALELLLVHEVALALIDVQMPGMDGFELAETMRGAERTRDVPIIFVTAGLHDQARIFKGYDHGAVDFLIKPLEPHVTNSKVAVFLKLWRQRQQLAERIAELESARARLREGAETSRRQLEEISATYDSAPVGLCLFDRELRYVRINQRLAEMNGVAAAEHLGRRVEDVVPSVAPLARELAERIFRTGEGVTDVEFTGCTPARPGVERVWVEQWLPLKNADGEVVGINVVAEEITERKQAEVELERLAQQRQLALDAARLGWWHYDPVRRLARCDPRYREILGMRDETVPFEALEDLLHPDDVPRVRAAIREKLVSEDPGPHSLEFRIHRPDGQTRWIVAHGCTVFEGEGSARRLTSFVGTVEDVTERREAEESLRTERALLQAVLESLPVAVWIADAQGAIERTNAAVERVWGKAPTPARIEGYDEYRGWWSDTGEPLAAEEWALARAISRGEVSNGEVIDIQRFDGSRATILNSAAPVKDGEGRTVGAVAVSEDITAAKKAEEALRRSESRLRHLAEALPQMIFEVDAEGRALFFNERWRQYTGRPPGEIEDRAQLVHPDDRARMTQAWAESLRTGATYECSYRFRRHDGAYRWLLARALPVLGADGRPERWIGAATDIDDLKQAQDALGLANEQLAEADRRKDEFLGILSHELRNPLAPIKNGLYILRRAEPGSDRAARAMEIIERQVNQLARLIDDLLDVTRVTRNKIVLQRETLELNELVARVVEDQHSLFERAGVGLGIEPAEAPLHVDGDCARLQQVVSNLLQNAAKFSAAGDEVRVQVERDARAGQATIRVRDTGAGMQPETLARIFQPFVQAEATLDRSQGGLGLGLALVKGLVELHGGEVSAHSEGLGRGSEFTLRLPLTGAPAVAAEAAAPARASRGLRVLVIEDNADAAECLRQALELCAHQVEVASSGPEGHEKARAFRPDVVLCDIGLPGMDGYQVARTFRADEALCGVHLVALSGYALPADLRRAEEAGFDRHLAKPTSLPQIEELLAEVERRAAAVTGALSEGAPAA